MLSSFAITKASHIVAQQKKSRCAKKHARELIGPHNLIKSTIDKLDRATAHLMLVLQ
jgi:hypothetical protein